MAGWRPPCCSRRASSSRASPCSRCSARHAGGRAALRRYFQPFLATALERGLPFVLGTATWRANPDWGTRLGYGDAALAAANAEAVVFARELAEGRPDVTINGVLGPRGDGYVAGERMSTDE